MTRRLGLVLVVSFSAAVLIAEFSSSAQRSSTQRRLSVELKDALAQKALTTLRNESEILVTGTPPEEGLVPRLVGMARLEFSGEDRIAALLKSRRTSLEHGKRYTSIDVTLDALGIEERDGMVILHGIEHVVEHLTFDRVPPPLPPDVYEESVRHDFIFSVTPVSATGPISPYSVRVNDFEYTVTKDITEPQLLKHYQQEEDGVQKDSPPPAVPLTDAAPFATQQKKKRP